MLEMAMFREHFENLLSKFASLMYLDIETYLCIAVEDDCLFDMIQAVKPSLKIFKISYCHLTNTLVEDFI